MAKSAVNGGEATPMSPTKLRGVSAATHGRRRAISYGALRNRPCARCVGHAMRSSRTSERSQLMVLPSLAPTPGVVVGPRLELDWRRSQLAPLNDQRSEAEALSEAA